MVAKISSNVEDKPNERNFVIFVGSIKVDKEKEIEGKNEGTHNKKQRETYFIGRNSQCDLQINKSEISRKQVEISFDQITNTWEMKDLNSTNGSWLKCQKAFFKVRDFLPQGEHLLPNVQERILSEEESILNLPSCLLSDEDFQPEKNTMKIEFKLGEMRIDLQIQNYEQYKSEVRDRIRNLKTDKNPDARSYERILEGLSIEEQQQSIKSEPENESIRIDDRNQFFMNERISEDSLVDFANENILPSNLLKDEREDSLSPQEN